MYIYSKFQVEIQDYSIKLKLHGLQVYSKNTVKGTIPARTKYEKLASQAN